MKKKVGGIISIVVLIPVLLFVAGIVAQFVININAWKAAGSDYRTSPGLPSLELHAIISALFTFPEGPIAIAAIVIGIALICVFGLRLGWNRGGMTRPGSQPHHLQLRQLWHSRLHERARGQELF